MASTVAGLFAAAGLTPAGAVPWGAPVPETGPGNYVVALTDDPYSTGATPEAPIDVRRLAYLLEVRPELRLDGRRASVDELATRLRGFWVPDEAVVYVGLAGTSVRRRVAQYYGTPLGLRKPHAGGWWLKTLSVLDKLWVHYAAAPQGGAAECAMLRSFAARVSANARGGLHDGDNPAPFANLRTGRGNNKKHGITGATGEVSAKGATAAAGHGRASSNRPRPASVPPLAGARGQLHSEQSQPVTAADIEAGRVRFPRAAKKLLPVDRRYLEVDLRGVSFEAVRWDPRIGPDRDRSGVLAFGKGALNALVVPGEVLAVGADPDGRVQLD